MFLIIIKSYGMKCRFQKNVVKSIYYADTDILRPISKSAPLPVTITYVQNLG